MSKKVAAKPRKRTTGSSGGSGKMPITGGASRPPVEKKVVPTSMTFLKMSKNMRTQVDAADVVHYLIAMGCPNTAIDFSKRMKEATASIDSQFTEREVLEAIQSIPVCDQPILPEKKSFWALLFDL